MHPVTTSEFISSFIEFEKKNSLFSIEVRGHSFWDCIRYGTHKSFINFKPDYVVRPKKYGNKLCEFSRMLGTAFRNHMLLKEQYDVVVLSYDRRSRLAGVGDVNIHIYPVIKQLSSKYRVLLLEPAPLEIPVDKLYPCSVVRTRPYRFVDKLKAYFVRYTPEEREIFGRIGRALEDRFNVKLDIEKMARNNFSYYLQEYERYRRMLRKISPKAVIFCDSGNRRAVIAAAKSLNIKTIDMQHSLVSGLNVLYNYPRGINYDHVKTLPDCIFTYGPYWNEEFKLPVKTVSVGWPFLENKIRELDGTARSGEDIIIITGSYSKKEFIDMALKLSELLPDRTIYFKLRIEDYEGWRDRYPAELQARKNIKIIGDKGQSLHEYFPRCRYQVGINSTGIYEGMAFGLTTFIMKTGWYREMEKLYNNGHAFLVSSADEMAEKIKSNARARSPLNKEDVFKSNSLQNIEEAMRDIIKIGER